MGVTCPSCDEQVPSDAWICPFCEFIIDPSVLDGPRRDSPVFREAAEAPEAMILGDVTIDPDDFELLPGAAANSDGRTSTFLFYTSGATSRVLRPDVVPQLEPQLAPRVPTTPYEDFLLASIDGKRTVREIQLASGLAPQEVTITLLTLLDKKIIRIEARPVSEVSSSTLAVEELPIAKPRSSSRGSKRRGGSKARSRASSAKSKDADRRPAKDKRSESGASRPGGEVREDILAAVRPSALEAGDTEETTEFAPVPGGTPPPSVRPAAPAEGSAPPASSQAERSRARSSDARGRKRRSSSEKSAAREPGRPPSPRDALLARAVTPLAPEEREDSEESDPTPPPRAPVPATGPATARPPGTPPPPVLDPSFLVEVRPPSARVPPPLPSPRKAASERALGPDHPGRIEIAPPADALPSPKGAIPEPGPPAGRSAEAARARPAPVQPDALPKPPPPPPPPPKPAPAKAAAAQAPVDVGRMAKASKLFEEALRDKAEGNMVSARMNMKLALTFDPTNPLYVEAYEDLAKSVPTGKTTASRAKDLHDKATDAERSGRIEEAIQLLERGIEEMRDPSFHNRLGVLLATKKREYSRAQRLVETALEISPGNATYQHNLGKVLQMAAAQDVSGRESGDKKKGGGLLDFLGRKK
ncbi:MAG: hypothetical protein IT384_34745 [Deltaproteobacteria bacterium]|nr:hypothetical protein [Deltaproteobacteria bacterium]